MYLLYKTFCVAVLHLHSPKIEIIIQRSIVNFQSFWTFFSLFIANWFQFFWEQSLCFLKVTVTLETSCLINSSSFLPFQAYLSTTSVLHVLGHRTYFFHPYLKSFTPSWFSIYLFVPSFHIGSVFCLLNPVIYVLFVRILFSNFVSA